MVATMTSLTRYAIYYAPDADSALARFGAGMLGYDAGSGSDAPFPAGTIAAVPDWSALTADPRKYGFHATLKAPFTLAPGRTEAELFAACDAFAATPRTIPVVMPSVQAISGFIAVVPDSHCDALQTLAQDCVEAFDAFRAPLSAQDRARRKPETLTTRQLEQLDRWGYPYVLQDFRFHMTLTGRLDLSRRDDILAVLRERFAALAIGPLAIDRIVVFRQDERARFRIVRRCALVASSKSGT